MVEVTFQSSNATPEAPAAIAAEPTEIQKPEGTLTDERAGAPRPGWDHAEGYTMGPTTVITWAGMRLVSDMHTATWIKIDPWDPSYVWRRNPDAGMVLSVLKSEIELGCEK
jgi:hypothetical protein